MKAPNELRGKKKIKKDVGTSQGQAHFFFGGGETDFLFFNQVFFELKLFWRCVCFFFGCRDIFCLIVNEPFGGFCFFCCCVFSYLVDAPAGGVLVCLRWARVEDGGRSCWCEKAYCLEISRLVSRLYSYLILSRETNL